MSEPPGFFRFLAGLLFSLWAQPKITEHLAADHRDDPVYRENVRKLIERNREFEKDRE
jgi:hypothetical protein